MLGGIYVSNTYKEKLFARSMAKKKREPKRLYRSKTNRVIAGVAGGIAEYFAIDPVLIRLIFILLLFAGGMGILIYLLAWILVPENPNASAQINETRGSVILGIILLIIGVIFLFRNLFHWFHFGIVWPAILIILGIYLIVKQKD